MTAPTISLHLGDCREVMATLGAGSVDAVVTDPPYGKGFHDGGIGGRSTKRWVNTHAPRFEGVTIANDATVDTFCVPLMASLLKDGGALYLFSQWMVEDEWRQAITDAGLTVRNRIIWAKPKHGAGDLKTTFGPQHESIIFATKGRHELRGSRNGDVWTEPFGANGCFDKGKLHPNQKPVPLIRWLIAKSTDRGDLILDPYTGSGTTGVACLKTGRSFIGIESDPTYFAIAQRRLDEARTPLLDQMEAAS